MTITKNNIKLEGNGFLPHDSKNYWAYFENDINFPKSCVENILLDLVG